MSDAVVVPSVRVIARHAVPNLIEAKLVPVALFLAALNWWGTSAALLLALLWSLAAAGRRLARGARVPGLIVLGTVALLAKTIVALATGSLVVYFLQPTVTTALVGVAFFVSVPLGAPLAERLVHDFCPLDEKTKANPVLRRFFARVSVLWAFTSLVNAAVTVWLLLTQSTNTFVVVKSCLGPLTTAVTMSVAAVWFRSTMTRTGTPVVYARARQLVG